MGKVNSFLNNLRGSLIPHHFYYQKISRQPFYMSILYFIGLLFLINVILFISILLKFSPSKVHASISSVGKSVSSYPDNLVLTLHQGGLVSTYERPYFFWMNDGSRQILLAVIDENAVPSKIYEYRSFALVSARTITFWPSKNTNKIHTYPLSFLGDRTITRADVESLMSITGAFNRVLPIVYIIVAALFLSLSFISSIIINLLYIAFASVIILLLFRLVFPQKRAGYLSTYKIGLHAVTTPLFVLYGLSLIGIQPSHMHVLFFILLVIFIGGGLHEALWTKRKD